MGIDAAARAMAARSLSAPAAGFYVQQLIWRTPGPLDIEAARRAWEEIARKYDALRIFAAAEESGDVRQFLAERVAVQLEVKSGSEATAEDSQALERFLWEDRQRGIALDRAPLWRVTVFQNSQSAVLVWTFHHLILDGRSHALVFEEWRRVYEGGERGEAPAWADFLNWIGGAPAAGAERYWREQMRGWAEAVSLPTLAVDAAASMDDEARTVEETALDEDQTRALRAAATRLGVSLNNLVQGAWGLALARYNGAEEATFGVVRACRHWKEAAAAAAGMFVNTIPLRVGTAAGRRVGDFLAELKGMQLAARAGEFADAARIRRWANLGERTALFTNVLMFEDFGDREPLELREKTDGVILAAHASRRMVLRLDAPAVLHPAEQARFVLGHVRQLLLSMTGAAAELPLGGLAMHAPEEKELIDRWSRGRSVPFPLGPVARILEEQAKRSPDEPAVKFGATSISYRQLHLRADQLAHRLLELTGERERVAVMLHPARPDQVIAWLALLKTNLVYCPMDPSSPAGRMGFLFQDIQPAVVVTHRDLASRLPPHSARVICLDDPEELAHQANLPATPPVAEVKLEDAACFLSTSGSTGTPKSTILSHRSMHYMALSFGEAFDLRQGDRVAQLSSMVYDFTLFELLCLQSGATLVLGEWAEMKPGPALADFLSRNQISVMATTPSAMRAIPLPLPASLRLVVSGGEPMTADLVQKWSGHCRLVNTCGPSECAFWSTSDECRADGKKPSIGRSVENATNYVLDENLRAQPVGVPGEQFIGGLGVGLGYWNREELTSARYVADPFAGDGARMYRTGDLLRWMPDGRLEYLRRLDTQIKFRGVRIELGEIEASLMAHAGVKGAVVMVRGEALAAFLTAEENPSPEELCDWLAPRLPLFMIPTEFEFLAEFPRHGNGKIDRRALLNRRGAGCVSEEAGEAFDLSKSVVDMFREQAALRPEATALVRGEKLMSHGELDRLSDALAIRLAREGLEREGIVALLLERSMEFVVAALGVLKAGGSYLPLDVAAPRKRLEFQLEDCGARLAVSDREWKWWKGKVLKVEDGLAEKPPEMLRDPSRRAYLIYTSGSTGKPKAVEIEHHSLSNLVFHYQRRLRMDAGTRATMLAHVTFDASVADLWPSLCAGGAVLIPDRDFTGDADGEIEWIARSRATFAFVPTALAEIMIHRPWPADLALRTLATGGDALRVRPPAGLGFTLLNTYGPTENTVDSTWSEVAPQGAGAPPIGRAISSVRAYVLDDELKPVAGGDEGELYLGGEQVARGYLNRPELTAERFVPDPFSKSGGARMYRTGDRVRLNANGELEFLGRRDHQIQIRGQRVELEEIEAVLREHEMVADVCCVAIGEGQAISGVAAHVAARSSPVDVRDRLMAHAAERLPRAMVPKQIVLHGALPRNAAGKVDREALRGEGAGPVHGAASAPELDPMRGASALDRALTQIWRRMLRTTGEDETRSFWDLGGDSLRAVELSLAVQDLIGQRMPVSSFFMQPNLAGLKKSVGKLFYEGVLPVLALRRHGTRRPAICLYGSSGDVAEYFYLANALGDDQPVFAVRSAGYSNAELLPASMEEAAATAIKHIRATTHARVPALIGHSWGGLLAFEVARQILKETGECPFVGLIGSHPPLRKFGPVRRALHFVRWFPAGASKAVRDWSAGRWRNPLAKLRFIARSTARTLAPKGDYSPELPSARVAPIIRRHYELAFTYRPAVMERLSVDLFRERASFPRTANPLHPLTSAHVEDFGWSHWVKQPPRLHWVEGAHGHAILPAHVEDLAAKIRGAMDEFDGKKQAE